MHNHLQANIPLLLHVWEVSYVLSSSLSISKKNIINVLVRGSRHSGLVNTLLSDSISSVTCSDSDMLRRLINRRIIIIKQKIDDKELKTKLIKLRNTKPVSVGVQFTAKTLQVLFLLWSCLA